MKCPRCGIPGRKVFKGYCSKVHWKLDKRPKRVVLECARCGDPVVRLSSQVSKGGNVYCKRCPKNSGETHPNWKEGQYYNKGGYRVVLINGEYKLEHRWIWEQSNQACLLTGMGGAIHHVDFNKQNNAPDNLLLLSNTEHGRVHRYIDNYKYVLAFEILVKAGKLQLCFPKNIILMTKQWRLSMTQAERRKLDVIAKAAHVQL